MGGRNAYFQRVAQVAARRLRVGDVVKPGDDGRNGTTHPGQVLRDILSAAEAEGHGVYVTDEQAAYLLKCCRHIVRARVGQEGKRGSGVRQEMRLATSLFYEAAGLGDRAPQAWAGGGGDASQMNRIPSAKLIKYAKSASALLTVYSAGHDLKAATTLYSSIRAYGTADVTVYREMAICSSRHSLDEMFLTTYQHLWSGVQYEVEDYRLLLRACVEYNRRDAYLGVLRDFDRTFGLRRATADMHDTMVIALLQHPGESLAALSMYRAFVRHGHVDADARTHSKVATSLAAALIRDGHTRVGEAFACVMGCFPVPREAAEGDGGPSSTSAGSAGAGTPSEDVPCEAHGATAATAADLPGSWSWRPPPLQRGSLPFLCADVACAYLQRGELADAARWLERLPSMTGGQYQMLLRATGSPEALELVKLHTPPGMRDAPPSRVVLSQIDAHAALGQLVPAERLVASLHLTPADVPAAYASLIAGYAAHRDAAGVTSTLNRLASHSPFFMHEGIIAVVLDHVASGAAGA